jgi:DNA-binding HxlR family transcriptional regulator
MKRDMDLVRKILFNVESQEKQGSDIEIEGCDPDTLRLHLRLMEEAGLLHKVTITSGSMSCMRLTWAGYDFLEAARNDTRWNRAKTIVIEKTGSLTVDALSGVLKALIKSAIDGVNPFV